MAFQQLFEGEISYVKAFERPQKAIANRFEGLSKVFQKGEILQRRTYRALTGLIRPLRAL